MSMLTFDQNNKELETVWTSEDVIMGKLDVQKSVQVKGWKHD